MSSNDSPARPPHPTGAGALGCGCAVLVVLLGVLVLVFVQLTWGSAGAADYPRVAPEEMAERAFERSQEAYDVLGFTRTVRPGVEKVGVSTENTFDSGFCYDGGPLGLDDKTVDGAYTMSHDWALDEVPASQAVPGLRRLHQRLKDDGWEVTSYREGTDGQDWSLFVQRDDGDERMSFTWFPDRAYFLGGASVPCAYDPAWEEGDVGPAGDDVRPPVFGPA
ncbi:hypothetical protein OG866_18980 [Streptomyces sp. NBC_00663]|uniref:hypothetical protein n=1 Tax=Streptomyces sp. NBC_00663 TaxID=2975801 RepID=UPI002E308683|nr:hypothetical protein [Streptomyces sp. NBC_00663]